MCFVEENISKISETEAAQPQIASFEESIDLSPLDDTGDLR